MCAGSQARGRKACAADASYPRCSRQGGALSASPPQVSVLGLVVCPGPASLGKLMLPYLFVLLPRGGPSAQGRCSQNWPKGADILGSLSAKGDERWWINALATPFSGATALIFPVGQSSSHLWLSPALQCTWPLALLVSPSTLTPASSDRRAHGPASALPLLAGTPASGQVLPAPRGTCGCSSWRWLWSGQRQVYQEEGRPRKKRVRLKTCKRTSHQQANTQKKSPQRLLFFLLSVLLSSMGCEVTSSVHIPALALPGSFLLRPLDLHQGDGCERGVCVGDPPASHPDWLPAKSSFL